MNDTGARDGAAVSESLLPDTTTPLPVPLRHAFAVLWPAFLVAGVLETLTFAVIDPADLRWFGSTPIGWSSSAVYTVTFLLYWLVISLSGALTLLLVSEPAGTPAGGRGGWGRHWP